MYFPPLLTYGPKVVEPKLDFLVNEMGRNVQELEDFPSFLSCDFELRIAKRYKILKRRGRTDLSLEEMFRCSDRVFATKYLGYGQVYIPIN